MNFRKFHLVLRAIKDMPCGIIWIENTYTVLAVDSESAIAQVKNYWDEHHDPNAVLLNIFVK